MTGALRCEAGCCHKAESILHLPITEPALFRSKGDFYRTLLDARRRFLCLHSAPRNDGTVQRFLATQNRSGSSFGGMGLGVLGRLNSYVASIEERYKSLSLRIGN